MAVGMRRVERVNVRASANGAQQLSTPDPRTVPAQPTIEERQGIITDSHSNAPRRRRRTNAVSEPAVRSPQNHPEICPLCREPLRPCRPSRDRSRPDNHSGTPTNQRRPPVFHNGEFIFPNGEPDWSRLPRNNTAEETYMSEQQFIRKVLFSHNTKSVVRRKFRRRYRYDRFQPRLRAIREEESRENSDVLAGQEQVKRSRPTNSTAKLILFSVLKSIGLILVPLIYFLLVYFIFISVFFPSIFYCPRLAIHTEQKGECGAICFCGGYFNCIVSSTADCPRRKAPTALL